MIRLYTGRPGTGKTLKAVSDLVVAIEVSEKEKDPAKKRTFYADINGLKIDGVLPPPDDWRDTPEGSTIIYDEAQLRKEYAAARGASQYQMVRDLTIHRHGNRDVWFITQMPRLIHNDVLDVVNEHIHLVRPYGANLATCYFWRKTEKNPDSRNAKDRAESQYIFSYRKDLYKFYHSAVDHTVKLKIPRMLIFIVLGILFCIYLVFRFAFGSKQFIDPLLGNAPQIDQVEQTPPDVPTANNAPSTEATQSVDGPHDNLSQSSGDNYRIYVLQQLEQKYLQPYTVEVAEFDTVRPALVAQMGNECRAYNQFGDLLNIDDSLCKSMLKEVGLKPRARKIFNEYNNEQAHVSLETQPTLQVPSSRPQTQPTPQKTNSPPTSNSEFIFESATNHLPSVKPTEVVPATPKQL